MRIACACLFCLFTFSYLYFYQADIMAVGQHVLSGGQTSYNSLVGAVLITFMLFLLHWAVYSLTHLYTWIHALTYFPSLLVLTILTDVSPSVDEHFSFGAWLWVAPLLLVVYAGMIWFSKQIQQIKSVRSSGLFSNLMWVNVLTMTLMFFFVGIFSNHNDVFHYRMRMETLLLRGDYEKALEVGKRSLATDSSLTMLRAYALSRQGKLAERLFEYPLDGGSQALVPNGKSVKAMIFPAKKIARFTKGRQAGKDYKLMALLLDKNLAAFVSQLRTIYPTDSLLPKHYREALVLYNYLNKAPSVVYRNAALETDFHDFLVVRRKTTNPVLCQSLLRDTYGDTYWCYYAQP